MKKPGDKIISALLAVCLLLSAAPLSGIGGLDLLFPVRSRAAEIVDSGSCGKNVTWTLDADGTLTVSGSGPMSDYEWGKSPFFGNDSIQNAVITSGVTSIGWFAFYLCSALTSVTIPNGVTSIGNYAFEGCSALTSVTIPSGVTSIGDYAFYDCSALTSVTIPESVTSIGEGVFRDCSALTSVAIPNGVTSIGDYAFLKCSSLTSVTIPNGVTSIGWYAFSGCSALTSITIPDSVTSIGDYAFSYCSALGSITVDPGNPVYHSEGNCLIETGSKTLILGCKNSVIPADGSVTSIGGDAFSGCSALASITIPDSVTWIGGFAFSGCSALTSVTIPNSVTSIGDSAFEGCSALTSVTIPDSVTRIADYAFSGCSALTDVYYTGSSTQWERITIGDSNDPLLNAVIHFDYVPAPAIDTDTAKELGDKLYAAPQSAAALLALAGEGATLSKDGTPIAPDAAVGSGMVLTKTDGMVKTVIVKGDNDGDGMITASDARFALRVAVDLETPNAWETDASRVAGGETVTAADARAILRAAVGLENLKLV